MVSSATMAATTANTGTGARKISASTIGIRTTAVAMRLSKGVVLRDSAAPFKIFARIQNFNHRGNEKRKGIWSPCGCLGPLGLRFSVGCRRSLEMRVSVFVIKPAIAALALLILLDAFEQVCTAKIRP